MFIVMLGILKFEVTAIEKVMILYFFKKMCKMKRDLKNRLFTKKSTRNQKSINFFYRLLSLWRKLFTQRQRKWK